MQLPFLAGFDQFGYVTNDIEQAQAKFTEYGIPKFHVVETTLRAKVYGQPGTIDLAIGFANIGNMQIELIEPRGGLVDLYAEPLPKDGQFGLLLHHLRVRISGSLADWARARAEIDEAERPVVLDGAYGEDVRFVYVDDRDNLGHYFEYVWFSKQEDARRSADIPSYPSHRIPA